jgi:hypothetical protein
MKEQSPKLDSESLNETDESRNYVAFLAPSVIILMTEYLGNALYLRHVFLQHIYVKFRFPWSALSDSFSSRELLVLMCLSSSVVTSLFALRKCTHAKTRKASSFFGWLAAGSALSFIVGSCYASQILGSVD